MKIQTKRRSIGVTLIEMMLVMVIVSSLVYMGVRYSQQRTRDIGIDRAVGQIQEIMNAGLSYYVNNGSWPANINTLQTGGYLPATVISPWGTNYNISSTAASNVFNVSVSLPAGYANSNLIGQILAGRLPFGVSNTAGTTTTITASVNMPGGNLNNAGNINFAGLYKNGACVPAPKCPTDSSGVPMTRQIFVAPASVSGMNDTGATNVYPMSSITAFASPLTATVGGAGPPPCGTSGSGSNQCYTSGNTPVPDGDYWRVCLQVYTTKGKVVWDDTTSPYATVLAMTRCAIAGEATGSQFTVWEK